MTISRGVQFSICPLRASQICLHLFAFHSASPPRPRGRRHLKPLAADGAKARERNTEAVSKLIAKQYQFIELVSCSITITKVLQWVNTAHKRSSCICGCSARVTKRGGYAGEKIRRVDLENTYFSFSSGGTVCAMRQPCGSAFCSARLNLHGHRYVDRSFKQISAFTAAH